MALLAIAIFLLSGAVVVSVASAEESKTRQQRERETQPEAYQERLVEWLLEDPESFFHPSILWKRLGPGGTSGPYAMHATEDIASGTPLIFLPRKYVLESLMKPPDELSETYRTDPRMCATVEKMLDEHFNRKNESFYAPYLSYLFDDTAGGTSRGLLPTSWSDHSKGILDLILDKDGEDGTNNLDPHDYTQSSVFSLCADDPEEDSEGDDDDYDDGLGGDDDDDGFGGGRLTAVDMVQEAEDAFLFLTSRGWYDKLLPIVDMFNHRNGPGRNVEVTPVDEETLEDVVAYAWRDIAEGEQLQYTYSECMDDTCGMGSITYTYSTQAIFGDYGFVELYPRRWRMNAEEDDEFVVEVSTDSNDDTKKVLRWIYDAPTKENILWVEEELVRLRSIESRVREGVNDLERVLLGEGQKNTIHNIDHERDTIIEFYEAYIEVFELALKHKDDPVAVTDDDIKNELERIWAHADKFSLEKIRNHELIVSSRKDGQKKITSTPGGSEF
eukprot:CAMPEP_0201239892 /NCGR_PEP_ID=MMETSP0852-20130820/27142_1 /ASSEMBLY_ACC=CAM_ASM_000632 /TAXON_ID=183588 /ORGANISM="Pseudo-nitzschia fraudulenta, Strain WWA7" /LENGTH=499 /DNA_ID=CAMNT_0047535493 /DNA_START=7 /DNA_END=1506 /DNA_ORIENTATION=-